MPNMSDIVITPDILRKIAEIDTFKGSWNSGGIKIEPEQLKTMKRIATIESIGSSNRIEGNKLNDIDVETVFNNITKKSFQTRDEQEVAGYADLLATIFDSYQDIPLSENYIRQLHKILLSYSTKDERHRGEYKKDSNRVAAFDSSYTYGTTVEQRTTPPRSNRLWETPHEGHRCTKDKDGFGHAERKHCTVHGRCVDFQFIHICEELRKSNLIDRCFPRYISFTYSGYLEWYAYQ